MFRRHRPAVGRLQSRAPDACARHHADLRIRHARHQAERAAAVDRRRRIVRDRADHGVGAGNVPLLAAGRPHQDRLPRRRADRQIRQSQHHGGRPLRQAEGAAARRRRRAGDRHLLRRDFHHHGAGQAQLRRQARFRHLDRPCHRRRQPRQARRQDQGPDPADHRSGAVRARSRDQGDDRGLHSSRRHPRADPGEHRLGGANSPRQVAETPPPTPRELEVLRELHARTDRAHMRRRRDGDA